VFTADSIWLRTRLAEMNDPYLLSVLVGSDESAAGRRHVRESKMREFGELEAVIMERLWEWGRPALVREMVDDLRDDRPLAYTTVMTVMENLYHKGWLRRCRDGRAWRYEPTGSRSAYTAALMSSVLAASADRRTALAHFVLQMSPFDTALLEQALDHARRSPEAGQTR
jgi:predicted transcriptional regulator